MKFLLAPNAMKGALSASKIAVILSKTIRRKFADADIASAPVADGGNGTLDCLMNAMGGTIYEQQVTGPVPSLTFSARYGITADNTAIIESAEAAGLHLVTPSPETIAQSTTRGIGELINAALEQKCSRMWIGLGGTATNDGGAGMARALGIHLQDENGSELKEGAVHLLRLHAMSRNEFLKKQIPVTILADANNILLGEQGATFTYAIQKGATVDQLPYLEGAVKNFADVVETAYGISAREIPGAGAAGGLGFGLMAFCGGTLVSGIDRILDTLNFDDLLSRCDCVITTEGMLDEQTTFGKGIAGIAERARRFHKPVHAFVGRVKGHRERLMTDLGLSSLIQVSPEDLSTPEAMRDASWLLADAVYHHSFS